MYFEGDEKVLSNLFKKQQLLRAGDFSHQAYRPLLLILSGTMRGVYGGGQVIALERFGLSEAFDVMVGVSTGMPTVAYFSTGQAVTGTSIYCEECVSSDFISLRHFRVDVSYLADVFRGVRSSKPLDQEALIRSRSSIFAAVTCAVSGEGHLIDVKKTLPDVVQALKASIAVPGFNDTVPIDGRHFTDGGGAHPFPFDVVCERFQPTDILVLANCPKESKTKRSAKDFLLTRLVTRSLPKPVQNAFLDRHKRFTEGVSDMRSHGCNPRWAIIWSDEEVGGFERNASKLVAAVERADTHFSGLLKNAKGLL